MKHGHHKSYKFRIFPNDEQIELINKTIGSSRFMYNHLLELWQTAYRETGKGLDYYECSRIITKMKQDPDFSWLVEVDSRALQSSAQHLAIAFKRFFTGENRHPRYKRKNNPRKQRYTTKNAGTRIRIEDNKIRLPKLGWVRYAKSREVQGRIIRVTVVMSSAGKYYASITAEVETEALPKTGQSVGIDLGLTDFAILSSGQKENNHRFTRKMEQKLAREQRKLSRRYRLVKARGENPDYCKNYQKQRVKVAKFHEKVRNQRNDFLNKLSTNIVKNHDVIAIEDLNVMGMMENKSLRKHIGDVSWSRFVEMLEYKAEWYGRELIKVSQWYPSTQICSGCHEHTGKKPLSVRQWTCQYCDAEHDRDVNASINILREGLRLLDAS